MKFLMQGLEIDTDTVKNENELGDILEIGRAHV